MAKGGKMGHTDQAKTAGDQAYIPVGTYLIRRGTDQFGPYSLEQINQYVATGSVLSTDLAWTTGFTDWVSVSSLVAQTPTEGFYVSRNGVVTGPYSQEQIRGFVASGNIAYSDMASKVGSSEWIPVSVLLKVELWNPDHCGLWSLLFTPIFGAILVSLNWKSLGEIKRAKLALIWILPVCVVLLIASFVTPFVDSKLANTPVFGFSFLILLLWYGFSQYPQAKFVKNVLKNKYIAKSELKPVGIAVGVVFVWILIVLVLYFAVAMFLGVV